MAGIIIPSQVNLSNSIPLTDISDEFWVNDIIFPPGNQDPGGSGVPGTPYVPGTWGRTYSSDPYNYVIIGNVRSPGYAQVDVRKDLNQNTKHTPGTNATITSFYGEQQAQFNIKFKIWTYDQWRKFKAFISPIINPKATTVVNQLFNYVNQAPTTTTVITARGHQQSPDDGRGDDTTRITTVTIPAAITSTKQVKQVVKIAFTIQQPELNKVFNISQFITKGLVGPVVDLKSQTREYTLVCLEYRPLQNTADVTQTPSQSAAPQVPLQNDAFGGQLGTGQAPPTYGQ